MLKSVAARAMTFVVVPDRALAKAFYEDVLGLAVVHEDGFACVFDNCGVELRLSQADGFAPQPHTVLGWQVADIAAAVGALRDKGVVFTIYEGFGQDEAGVWTAPGGATRVAWFKDPAGNVLSLTQFA